MTKKPEVEKKSVGRPAKEMDYGKLDALLQYKTTKAFVADYLGVSAQHIDNCIKRDRGMTFSEYHEHKMQRIASKLQEKAISMALGGNVVMLIFSLKNFAKWQDKLDVDVTHNLGNFTDWAKMAAEAHEKRRKQRLDSRQEKTIEAKVIKE